MIILPHSTDPRISPDEIVPTLSPLILETRHSIVTFDGRNVHRTQRFSGTRKSVILFNREYGDLAPDSLLAQLEVAGSSLVRSPEAWRHARQGNASTVPPASPCTRRDPQENGRPAKRARGLTLEDPCTHSQTGRHQLLTEENPDFDRGNDEHVQVHFKAAEGGTAELLLPTIASGTLIYRAIRGFCPSHTSSNHPFVDRP